MALDPNTIDGDRLIAFIKAVKDMGNILEQVNIIEVRECFLLGKQMGGVEKVLEQRKKWQEMMHAIMHGLNVDIQFLNNSKPIVTDMLTVCGKYATLAKNGAFNESIDKLKTLVELLDRLDAHKKSGLLEGVCNFNTSSSPASESR